jgi:micrococcal nuclease
MGYSRTPRFRRRQQPDITGILLRRRRWTRQTIIAVLVIIAISVALDRLGYFKYDGDDWKQFDQKSWFVSHVVDGDTVVIRDPAGKETHVRLLGIDAPELHRDGSDRPDYWARESANHLKDRIEGKKAIIRLEETQTRDRYGRLLAYLYVSDTDNLNLDLVSTGQVYADRRFYHTFSGPFDTAENGARTQKRGLWKAVQFGQMPPWRQDWLKNDRTTRVAESP